VHDIKKLYHYISRILNQWLFKQQQWSLTKIINTLFLPPLLSRKPPPQNITFVRFTYTCLNLKNTLKHSVWKSRKKSHFAANIASEASYVSYVWKHGWNCTTKKFQNKKWDIFWWFSNIVKTLKETPIFYVNTLYIFQVLQPSFSFFRYCSITDDWNRIGFRPSFPDFLSWLAIQTTEILSLSGFEKEEAEADMLKF